MGVKVDTSKENSDYTTVIVEFLNIYNSPCTNMVIRKVWYNVENNYCL